MEAHDELTAGREAPPGTNLAAIEKVWRILEADGIMPAIEELMRVCHENVVFQSYSAHGAARPGDGTIDVMRGTEAVLASFRKLREDGVSVKARAKSIEIEGESVMVRGTMRVVRADGSFAETKLLWNYHFRNGLIDDISWQARAGE